MRGFGFVPDWGSSNTAPTRTNKRAYFPVSLSATLREATFSETLAGILSADPSHTTDDFKEEFLELSELSGKEETGTELWNAFLTSYTTSAEGGIRGSSQSRQSIIPFHYSIATTIEVDSPRQWWQLYWLLMTDSEEIKVNRELHNRLVETILEMPLSNIVEKLAIEAIEDLENAEIIEDPNDVLSEDIYTPIPPLIPKCATAFQEDLRAWLTLKDTESTSRWMQGLRDILGYHYMMYVIQVAITLADEYEIVESEQSEAVESEQSDEFTFEQQPLYFGLSNETASQSRRFATDWRDDGIERAIYDSWGRLAIMNHIIEVAYDNEIKVEAKPYTLTSALEEFPPKAKEEVVKRLFDEFPEDQRPEDEYELAEAAIRFSHAVRRYYENQGKTKRAQTAWSAGENSLYYLGRGASRHFIERRRGVGVLPVLNRASLQLFARLFDAQKERGHIDEFWKYMRDRGIIFDHQSKQAVVEQLEGMGLLQKQSDSGEAMYVETI